MAAFDFPNNPATGDQAVGANGITYVWDGQKWSNGTVISVSQMQTPWLSNIDGANFKLNNVQAMGVGTTSNALNAAINVSLPAGSPAYGIFIFSGSSPGGAQIGLQNDAYNMARILLCGSAGQVPNSLYVSSQPSQPIVFADGWNEHVRITAGGRVGIATTTPQTVLDVAGNAFIRGTGPTPTTGAGIHILYTSNSSYIYSRDYGAVSYQPMNLLGSNILAWPTGSFQVATGYLSVGSYNTSGVTGDICVSDPNSTSQASGRIRFGLGGAAGPNILFNGTSWVFTPALPAGGGSQTPWLSDIDANTHSLYRVSQFVLGSSVSVFPFEVNTPGVLRTGTMYFNAVIDEPSASRGVALGYDTNAQIGVVAANSTSASSDLAFWNFVSASGYFERMRITSLGTVGIGTKLPTATLEVIHNPSAGGLDQVHLRNSINGDMLVMGYSDGSAFGYIQCLDSTGGIWRNLAVGGAGNVYICHGGGQVGIGTTSPAALLDVQAGGQMLLRCYSGVLGAGNIFSGGYIDPGSFPNITWSVQIIDGPPPQLYIRCKLSDGSIRSVALNLA